ncbi:hypothetical protein CsSME_00037406 [Camellia sinensis var. sinensis]
MYHIINIALDIPHSYTTHSTDALHLIYWPRPSYTTINHHSRCSYTAHNIHILQSFTAYDVHILFTTFTHYNHTAPFQIPATAGEAGRGILERSRSRTGHDDECDEKAVNPQSESSQDRDEAGDGSGSDSGSGADGGSPRPSSRKRTRRDSRS